MKHQEKFTLQLFLTIALIFPGLVPAAEPTSATQPQAVGDPADADQPSLAEPFEFFGFVNIGWGKTDGAKYRGLTEDGNGDLRNAALQLRYKPWTSTELVVQASHESVGTSPTNQFRDSVELDWLFLSHEFSTGTRVRLGRVPLPIGFYNEIKDVGTALPFYRPSGNFYGEGTWTSDSADGVAVSHPFQIGDWLASVDAYYGEWERIETDGGSLSFGVADINDALGFYAWLESPSGAFRIGVGANRFEAEGGVFLPPGVTDDEETRYLSLQVGDWPWRLRFEISRREFTGGYWQPYYAELVYHAGEKWRFAALYDVGHLYFEIPFFATFDDSVEELFALSASYAWTENLTLKLEHHWTETYGQIEDRAINLFFGEPEDVNLLIASVAWTF